MQRPWRVRPKNGTGIFRVRTFGRYEDAEEHARKMAVETEREWEVINRFDLERVYGILPLFDKEGKANVFGT